MESYRIGCLIEACLRQDEMYIDSLQSSSEVHKASECLCNCSVVGLAIFSSSDAHKIMLIAQKEWVSKTR